MRALDLVLPERCAICTAPGQMLCTRCRASFVRLLPPLCERCGSPGAWPVRRCGECTGRRLAFAEARSAIVYDDGARRFVRSWKERGQRRLTREAAALVAEIVPRPSVDALLAVPGDPERAWRRGDVPSRALAHELGRIWNLRTLEVLERSRSLPRQRGLSLETRRTNVRGSVIAHNSVPSRLCVVDDVYTSGATADACASACRRVGARYVGVVTLARAVR